MIIVQLPLIGLVLLPTLAWCQHRGVLSPRQCAAIAAGIGTAWWWLTSVAGHIGTRATTLCLAAVLAYGFWAAAIIRWLIRTRPGAAAEPREEPAELGPQPTINLADLLGSAA